MSTHPKPFINVVCDENSWGAFLQCFREGYKFSSPERYDPDLLDHHGRPLYFSTEFADFHVYPPGRYSDQEVTSLRTQVERLMDKIGFSDDGSNA